MFEKLIRRPWSWISRPCTWFTIFRFTHARLVDFGTLVALGWHHSAFAHLVTADAYRFLGTAQLIAGRQHVPPMRALLWLGKWCYVNKRSPKIHFLKSHRHGMTVTYQALHTSILYIDVVVFNSFDNVCDDWYSRKRKGHCPKRISL